MANPSTGFGGAGTEVIRRAYYDGVVESEQTILQGVANHIFTIISIIFADRSGQSDNLLSLNIDYDNGGTDLRLLTSQSTSSGTFIWNDRFALTETDRLWAQSISAAGTGSVDVWITYIDQQLA